MVAKIKQLCHLLTADQRNRLIKLQFLVVIMAFSEVAGVASIGPFMAVVGDMGRLQGEGKLAYLYKISGFESPNDFVFFLGVAVLVILTLAAVISMFTTWRLAMYGQQVGAELSTRLYKHYMSQPWLFHASGSSAQLTNKVSQECNRLTNQVIAPLLQLTAKMVLATVMSIAIFLINPSVALIGVLLFGVSYILLYRLVRHHLASNGKVVTDANRARFKLMNEGFGGIKDTLVLGRQADFNERFEVASSALGHAQGINRAIAQVPRYVMELIAFFAVISLVLYLMKSKEGDLGALLPVLSIYALAGFKLLPCFQQVYTGVTSLRSHISAFESLKDDFEASKFSNHMPKVNCEDKINILGDISLKGIFFRYPGKNDAALKKVDITLPVNAVIGLVGPSGSGKSTIIDILLGLIEPQEGKIYIDGSPLRPDEKCVWQRCIGYVPQSIFLADASIRENIAFGLPKESVDDEKVLRAVKLAHLEELVERLEDGIDTRVGERGVQLSGGQRQRIGIARALYDDPKILIMDEATSALDGITEKLVMDAIHELSGKKTVIMIAHRLATVECCDCIYVLDGGTVIDSGTYSQLVKNNNIFKAMANQN
ncbi:Phospholipid-lipopolysaccharide ABC transporter [Marinobacterium lacunae]|uniref:Phospholipid-lipopolysaccharide ABC transporter n=1 Tax=Marinobacterium lacunae TaxID=1232683 RepID=A0A081G0D2_9GAMM|nr:ABC transporter ATP-binding protein [Marinobacterium lacunae]KEA64237.1 Phospholipid-lipopolysaccharide ABC transporter [Marinobacterium lacunae]